MLTKVARARAEILIAEAPEGSDAQAAAKIATLVRLKGICENDATVLANEILTN